MRFEYNKKRDRLVLKDELGRELVAIKYYKTDGNLVVVTVPERGKEGEEAAIKLMKKIIKWLTKKEISHLIFKRKVGRNKHVDALTVSLAQLKAK